MKIIRPVHIQLRNIAVKGTTILPESRNFVDGIEINLIPNTTAPPQHLLLGKTS